MLFPLRPQNIYPEKPPRRQRRSGAPGASGARRSRRFSSRTPARIEIFYVLASSDVEAG